MPPTPRQLELQRKPQKTPEEEGELRGLFAHPTNSLAQMLVKKEYLASCGVGEFDDQERDQLRTIRADKYRNDTSHREERSSEPHRTTISLVDTSGLAGKAELDIIHCQGKIARCRGELEFDPRAFIEKTIADTPSRVKVYTKDTLHQIPPDQPSPLELYFLSLLTTLPDFKDVQRTDGSLRVGESTHCLRDRIRTKRFLEGVSEAVRNLEESHETIHVCDAGSGAVPILGVYAALTSPKTKVTCLELNPYSAQIARDIVEELHLSGRVKVVNANAETYVPEEPLDVLVSETMHSGLTAEPIVQILSHLSSFVKKDGIILPHAVHLKAAAIPVEKYASPKGFVRIYGNLHHFVEPSWNSVVNYCPGRPLEKISFSINPSPLDTGSEDYFVLLASEVGVGAQRLELYDSLITIPQVLREANGDPKFFKKGKRKVYVEYTPGDSLEKIFSV